MTPRETGKRGIMARRNKLASADEVLRRYPKSPVDQLGIDVDKNSPCLRARGLQPDRRRARDRQRSVRGIRPLEVEQRGCQSNAGRCECHSKPRSK